MQKLLLRCGFALGDIVMLTAAVRDLHLCYPGRFLTDVRTFYPELWEHNPHITPLSEEDPQLVQVDCSYPLINRAETAGCHCLHGFIDFFNRRLHLGIKLTALRGDIHLSAQEKVWASQVHELTGADTPFWVIDAGGKYDVTIKWWESCRYQQVVEHFRGKVQFVQVGQCGDHHPRLDGVIDLRGRTTLRELLRLVYHSQGVLCPVTGLMHLAAAVETRPDRPKNRPCVVVAGGREPAHWEAYPGHQFIHTSGALRCCGRVACWRDRAVRLRDGVSQDRRNSLCSNAVNALPACMALITPAEVIRRIQLYFDGGVLKFLRPEQYAGAQRGIAATSKKSFDRQPLNIHNAGIECDRVAEAIPEYPGGFAGRGIVICAGGSRYFTNAWVCIHMLRALGCRLPIQLWHLGPGELDERMKSLVQPLNTECVDACKVRRKYPARILKGWALKPYAIVRSRFREVLFLDADNVPVRNPESLFETPQFRATGALFWPDFHGPRHNKKAAAIWRSCGLREPPEREFETGQLVVDKARCWRALRLCLWFNENSDFYYQYVQGDKETFHLAFRKLRQRYSLIPIPIHPLEGTMCQHDFEGNRLFQHRNLDKWDLLLCNRRVKDFWYENDCRNYVIQLRRRWTGVVNPEKVPTSPPIPPGPAPRFQAVMISCAERQAVLRLTLNNLAHTDWGSLPVHVQMDAEKDGTNRQGRQTDCARQALMAALDRNADFILFLEDDLEFNRHIRHNLNCWKPIRARAVTLAGLYNPRLRELACDVPNNCRIVAPHSVFGSQALLISRPAVEYIVRNWRRIQGMQDIKISRLAGRLGRPILYHAPSLVQHLSLPSTWGGPSHQAMDFDPDWRA